MKRWLLVITILLCTHHVICKTPTKSQYRKKVNAWKKKSIKTSSKSPLDEFTNLPPEDYQFIKELDKQFKAHGNRLKIKIERENGTKSLKRNIDGSLGYGFQGLNHEQGYHFSPPKYVIYPYSQHDIPPAPISYSQHHQGVQQTVVDILPSKSFEIRENPVIYTTGPQQHYVSQYGSSAPDYMDYQHQPQPQVPEQYLQPIIVLRIPGPQKYAAHLQSLLQQYIEIRAAQILKEIEESEAQQNHPNYQQEQYSQSEGDHHHHQQQQQYQHPHSTQDYFPSIDQVYHIKKKRPHHHPVQEQQNEHQPHIVPVYGPPVMKVATAPGSAYESGYHQSQDYAYESQTETNNYHHSNAAVYQYHHVPIPIYVPESDHHSSNQNLQPHPVYGVPTATMYEHEHHDHSDESNLKTSENNPRNTHTRVHFTDAIKNNDHSTAYPLPSVTTPTRNIYLTPKQDNYDQQQHHHQHQHEHYDNYQQLESEYQTEQPVVEITQRPFNYHAHRVKQLAKAGHKRDTSTSTSQNTQIHKFHKVIRRIKKNSAEKSLSAS